MRRLFGSDVDGMGESVAYHVATGSIILFFFHFDAFELIVQQEASHLAPVQRRLIWKVDVQGYRRILVS